MVTRIKNFAKFGMSYGTFQYGIARYGVIIGAGSGGRGGGGGQRGAVAPPPPQRYLGGGAPPHVPP